MKVETIIKLYDDNGNELKVGDYTKVVTITNNSYMSKITRIKPKGFDLELLGGIFITYKNITKLIKEVE